MVVGDCVKGDEYDILELVKGDKVLGLLAETESVVINVELCI